MGNSMTVIFILHHILLKVAVLLKRIKAAGLNGPICAHFIQEHAQKKDYIIKQPPLARCIHCYILDGVRLISALCLIVLKSNNRI